MRPEILAPVGSKEALEAAIAAGCDAIYCGLPSFGARAFAKNFTFEEMQEVIDRCHVLGIKVHVTMNTLLYEDEIEPAYQQAKRLYEMGVDALIVQDLGLIHLIHHRLPQCTIHASTQLSTNNTMIISQLKKLGVSRVVLARECTLEEIKACKKAGLEIEVFVHGAICICYSGQCYFSSFRYNRSGNRGLCAQPCRMKYDLLENGKVIETKGNYLLSPKDLSLIDRVKELEEAGVDSLKIEGRMKSASYVYESVSVLKKTLEGNPVTTQDLENLQVSFNRGYTYGHAFKKRGNQLMNTKSCNHQGIPLGKVVRVRGRQVYIKLNKNLLQGDGIRIEDKTKDIGFYVNYLYSENGKLVNRVDAGQVCMVESEGVKVGSMVRKTLDSQLAKEIEALTQLPRKVSVQMKLSCAGLGQPLICTITDGMHSCVVSSTDVASQAMKQETNETVLNKQMKKTKSSWVEVEKIDYQLAPGIYFSISAMNTLRRDAIEALEQARKIVPGVEEKEYNFVPEKTGSLVNVFEVQSKNQIVDEEGLWVSEFIKESKANITELKGQVVSHLVEGEIVDFSMNVTNSYALAALRELGYKQVVVSQECSQEQILDMAKSYVERYGTEAPVTVPIYGRRRLMTMNHCPVNTALKDGQRNKCALCHQNKYELRGMDGLKALCMGDDKCHMRLFDEEITNEMDSIPIYQKNGITSYKCVFTSESNSEIKQVIALFKREFS
ncbi:MAG: U32 family peptidase [Firmicutes bacterium]|nr:U32 family peptidase [Bacillota bacterium]